MTAGTTIRVPHLGGITVGYRLSHNAVDHNKPTVVLINSMCMTSALYDTQFGNKELTDRANLLAIEPLGHGATETTAEHFTYWDTAIMAIQVLDALCIKKAFALGTSQGGWIVARMALVAPEKVCFEQLFRFYHVNFIWPRSHPLLPIPVASPSPIFSTTTARLQLRMACLTAPSPNKETCLILYYKE